MPTFRRMKKREEKDATVKRPAVKRTDDHQVEQTPADANLLSPSGVLQLQRTIGNRAVVQLIKERSAGQEQPVQRSLEEEEELECPGSMIRSGGEGKGQGVGQGQGPLGQPTEEELR